MKKVLIQGAAGFIGSHLARRLKAEGNYVVAVARGYPKYSMSTEIANEWNILDLTNPVDFHAHWWCHDFDECYQLSSESGGLGFIGTGDHDVDILTNSVRINLNTLDAMRKSQLARPHPVRLLAVRLPRHRHRPFCPGAHRRGASVPRVGSFLQHLPVRPGEAVQRAAVRRLRAQFRL